MEGPPLKVIAEKLSVFKGSRVTSVSGSAKIPYEVIDGETVQDISTVGKNLFIKFPNRSLKIHFLMFGSYRVNESRPGIKPRLHLKFNDGDLSFYNCPVAILGNDEVEKLYDREVDITSDIWNAEKVGKIVYGMKDDYICDVLLDQRVFAGVGNIIKNEALYMANVHPLSVVGKIPPEKLSEVVTKAREFSLLFYKIKKEGRDLDSRLKIYGKRQCPEGAGRVTKTWTGKRKRVSYFCAPPQVIYD